MSRSEGKDGEVKDSLMETMVSTSSRGPLSGGSVAYSESKEATDDGGGSDGNGSSARSGESAASRLTSSTPTCVDHIVLKFTTLSDGNEQASFIVGPSGGSVGRSSQGENAVFVPSDATLAPVRHAAIEHSSSSSSSSSYYSSSSSLPAAAETHSNFNFHGRVRFLPSLPHPAFLQLLKASSVVLDPFPFGGGVTTLEALAAGTPVVTLPAKQSVVQLAAGFYRAMTQFEKQQQEKKEEEEEWGQQELQQHEPVQWPVAVCERHFVRLAVAIASGAPAPPAPSSLPLASDYSAAGGAAAGGEATRSASLPFSSSPGPPPPAKETKTKKGTRLNEAETEGGEAGGAPVSSFREQLRRRILASHQALYQDDKAAYEWTELLLRLVRV